MNVREAVSLLKTKYSVMPENKLRDALKFLIRNQCEDKWLELGLSHPGEIQNTAFQELQKRSLKRHGIVIENVPAR